MFRAIFLCISISGYLLCEFAHAAEGPKIIAEGEWSERVTDNRGFALRGRLVLAEKPRDGDIREVVVYVELQDASEHRGSTMQIFCDFGRTDFRPEYKPGLHCELHDKDKKPVPASPFAFSGGIPGSEWITLPSDATICLRATPYGMRREKALAIAPHLGALWVIGNDDRGEYFLSGTFTVDPATDRKPPADGQVWRGTLVLPAMKITSQRR
ncbi:MAG TPA: hypothetical protein VFB96_06970 [Pirellulaceae bacterium]|nr:hypothetical protein [Pirellulaceae bacterium]